MCTWKTRDFCVENIGSATYATLAIADFSQIERRDGCGTQILNGTECDLSRSVLTTLRSSASGIHDEATRNANDVSEGGPLEISFGDTAALEGGIGTSWRGSEQPSSKAVQCLSDFSNSGKTSCINMRDGIKDNAKLYHEQQLSHPRDCCRQQAALFSSDDAVEKIPKSLAS